MNERIKPDPELTARQQYSTLDTRSTMAQDTGNEQPPNNSEAHRTRPQTHPEGWERDTQRNVDDISDWLRNNPDFRRDPEAFLREAGRRMPRTDEDLRNTREEILERPRRERLDPSVETVNLLDEAKVRKPRSFSEIIARAKFAPKGEMGAEFLNSLFEDAASLELPDTDPDRVAKHTQFEVERRQTIDALREQFDKIPHPREEAKKQLIDEFKALIDQAKESSGGEKISSIDTPEAQAIIKYLEEGFVFGGDIHEAIAEYLATKAKDIMTEPVREILFEQVWERFVGRADKLPEDQHYRESLGGLQAQNVFDTIKGLAETGFVDEHGKNPFAYYLNELAHVRSNMHDLNAAFRVGDEYKKAVVQEISAKGLHFVQNELTGVNSSIALWEKFLGDKVRERHQWLSQGDIDQVQRNVLETLGQMRKAGLLKKEGKVWTQEEMDRAISLGNKKEGDPLKEDDRVLTEWEINRAARLGKITMAGTQRLAMYAGYGDIPPEAQGRIGSLPYEYVARSIFNFKIFSSRFFTESVSVAYMKKLFKYMTKEEDGKDNGRFLELFGVDQRMIASNSLGAFDMESHSWRAQRLFLNNILLETKDVDLNGKLVQRTLQEFLDSAVIKNQKEGRDIIMEGAGAVPQEKTMKFLNETEDTILAQRLYLSVLTRLSLPSAKKGSIEARRVAEIKENIWKKIAILKPSTVISLLPGEMIKPEDQAMLDRVKQKLFIAEMKRVQDDTHEWASISHEGNVPRSQNAEQIRQEVKRFRNAIAGNDADYKYQILANGEFNVQEQEFIKKMIDRGLTQAKKLSGAEFSQTLLIDDAPFVAWTNTGFGETGRGGMSSEDIVRSLFSDQGDIAEGFKGPNSHVESPQTPTQEGYSVFVEKFGGVYGRGRAQGVIESFILSDLEIYKMDTDSLWIGGVEQIANKPRSEIMRYDRECQIAWDEKKREIYLKGLAQKNIISDNLTDAKAAGFVLTQLDKLKKRTRSNTVWQWIRNLRILIQYAPLALFILGKDTLSESGKSRA